MAINIFLISGNWLSETRWSTEGRRRTMLQRYHFQRVMQGGSRILYGQAGKQMPRRKVHNSIPDRGALSIYDFYREVRFELVELYTIQKLANSLSHVVPLWIRFFSHDCRPPQNNQPFSVRFLCLGERKWLFLRSNNSESFPGVLARLRECETYWSREKGFPDEASAIKYSVGRLGTLAPSRPAGGVLPPLSLSCSDGVIVLVHPSLLQMPSSS